MPNWNVLLPLAESGVQGQHVAQMTSQNGINQCFDAVTVNAAKGMHHLQGYGQEGCDASFVVLQAWDSVDAIQAGQIG
jgi:cytosine/creatinine deaminase